MFLRPSTRNEIRRNEYKMAINGEEGRRRREHNIVEIQKNKMGENLTKMRHDRVSAAENAINDIFWFLDFEKKFEAAESSEKRNFITDFHIPKLVQLLKCASQDTRKQAVLELGNIAADSPKCRDLILSFGGMTSLLAVFHDHPSTSMFMNVTWTLSKFCSGNPPPQIEHILPALSYLERLLESTVTEVLRDTCSALSYLSNGLSTNHINALVQAGVVPHLIKLLDHSSPSVLIPAVRAIGNIVTGGNLVIKMVLDYQILPRLVNLVSRHHEKSILKLTCWTISNIAAGNSDQIQAVMELGLIQSLICLLRTAELDVKEEAAWGILNVTCGGTNDQIKSMVNQGCIKPLCDLLISTDTMVIWGCLEALENILNVGESEKNLSNSWGENLHVLMINEAEGLKKIKTLQSHYDYGASASLSSRSRCLVLLKRMASSGSGRTADPNIHARNDGDEPALFPSDPEGLDDVANPKTPADEAKPEILPPGLEKEPLKPPKTPRNTSHKLETTPVGRLPADPNFQQKRN